MFDLRMIDVAQERHRAYLAEAQAYRQQRQLAGHKTRIGPKISDLSGRTQLYLGTLLIAAGNGLLARVLPQPAAVNTPMACCCQGCS